MATAIVTGGSKGLGKELTRALVSRGWQVVIDGRDPDVLGATAADIGDAVIAIPGDVADADHRKALVEASGDSVDLVVANASTLGASPLPRLADLSLEVFERTLAVNLVAPLGLFQLALPVLGPGAAIIAVTSDAAVNAYEGWGGYGSSKAALEHLHAVLAAEHPDLRVWWVDPGDLRTEMHQAAFPGEDISDRPPPETAVPLFLRLLDERPPSGRIET